MNRVKVFWITYIGLICATTAIILGFIVVFYPLKYKNEIVNSADEFSLSPQLIASVINAESNFDKFATSSAGALGLMQLMPATAQDLANVLNITNFKSDDLYIPEINIRLGCYYLSLLLKRYGDLTTALFAYNAGPGKVNNWLNDTQYSQDGKTLTKTPYPATNHYAEKVKRKLNIYSNFF